MFSPSPPISQTRSGRKRARIDSPPPLDSPAHSQSSSQQSSLSQPIESSQPSKRITKRARYQSLANLMKEYRWTTKDVLQFWLEENDIELNHRFLRTSQQRQQALKDALVATEAQIDFVQQVRREFDQLAECQYFSQFEPEPSFSDINFDTAVKQVQTVAPIWHCFITQLLQNQRTHWDSSRSDSQKNLKRQFTITAMICHSQRVQRSNFLMTTLSMYLGSSGVKRRVIDTLAGLGICYGYGTTLGLMNQLSTKASVSVALE